MYWKPSPFLTFQGPKTYFLGVNVNKFLEDCSECLSCVSFVSFPGSSTESEELSRALLAEKKQHFFLLYSIFSGSITKLLYNYYVRHESVGHTTK